jgi:site-specific recombinase XerD
MTRPSTAAVTGQLGWLTTAGTGESHLAPTKPVAANAGVAPPPDGAMAHALRHIYGMDLAMRGVPWSVIRQLRGHDDPRTTPIYSVAHAEDLFAALAEAGSL